MQPTVWAVESKLKIIDSENSRLEVTMKGKEKTIEFMLNKCNTLEDPLKAAQTTDGLQTNK